MYAKTIKRPKRNRNQSGIEGRYHYEVEDMDTYQNLMTPVPLKKVKSPKRSMSVSKHQSALKPRNQQQWNSPVKPVKRRKKFENSPIQLDACAENPEDVMKSLDELEYKH